MAIGQLNTIQGLSRGSWVVGGTPHINWHRRVRRRRGRPFAATAAR